jgi:glycosyltransferase involved in cell wall biosynthesis
MTLAGLASGTKPRMQSPLNVVYIRDHLIAGGGTAALLDTLPRFDPRRIAPSLCVLQPGQEIAQAFQAAGVATLCIRHRKVDPRSLLDAKVWVQIRDPALLVLSGPRSLIIGGLLARSLRLPTSPFFNHMILDSKLMTMVQRRLSSTVAIAVASSHAARDWACARYGLPARRVEVVYPGHDVGRFAAIPTGAGEAVRATLGLAPTAPVIALVGRLVTAQKGQDLMIRAMPEVLRQCPDAVLLIVGDGPDRATVGALASRLGRASAVRFLGWRDDIAGLLAASNVVAVPSMIDEAFGLTALEGMAAGRPVIAFASGGLPELVRHGETGFLVPRGDLAGLAAAILRLLTDAALRHRLGAAGRRVAAAFTSEARVNALSDIYERIAATSKRL